MIGGFLARLADDRYVQSLADNLSDLSSRYALIGHAVIPCVGRLFLEREPIKMSSIDPMYSRPMVEPIPDICGNALFTSDANQAWHEAVIAVAMDRWGKPQHRCPDPADC